MGKKYTKKEAVSIAISAARLYKDNFVGKRLLFVVADKHKKVSSKNANLSASMMGNFNNSHPLLYTEKLVGGVKWALGFRDVTGTGDYVPDTLLEGDIRDNIKDSYRIIATYIKGTDESVFSQIIYRAKKIDCDKLKYPDDWGSLPRLEAEDNNSVDNAK